jgi:acyl-CoA thioester hydrolase
MSKTPLNYHQISFRVRYSETDQMGVVYHGSYIPYFEMARVEWLRNKGVSYKELEEQGFALPIVSMKIDYKKPARYDDLITVTARMLNYAGVKLSFECEIYNESNELLTTSHFLLVFVSTSTGKPCLPPEEIQQFLTDILTQKDNSI